MRCKKLISIVIGAALLVTAFAGCGNSNKEVSSEKNESENVTLIYSLWDKNQEPVYREVADIFEQSHPKIKIKIELTPYKQYWTKMETAAAGQVLPDVLWMNGPNIAKYASCDILKSIDDDIEVSNFDLSNYPEALVNLYTVKDKKYGIPKDWDTTALWYNKEIFDNAGVAYPDDTWDFDKLREAAKKLTDKTKGIYGIAAPVEDQCGYYNTMLQAGGYAISADRTKSGFDLPESIEGIKCWINLIEDGSSATGQELTDTTAASLFKSGKLAMIYDASWNIPEYKNNEYTNGKVDLVVMPKMKQRGAVIHGVANVISSQTKHPEEAWEFVKFLSEKEANIIVAKSGVVIPAYKPVLDEFINANEGLNVQAFVDELDYSTMYPSSVDTSKWVKAQNDYLKKAWAGQITVEEACKKIAEEMNEVLANEK